MNPGLFSKPSVELFDRLRSLEIERDEILLEIKRRQLSKFQPEKCTAVKDTSYIACGDALLFINKDSASLREILRQSFKPGLRDRTPESLMGMTHVDLVNTILLLKGLNGAAGYAPKKEAPAKKASSGGGKGRRGASSDLLAALS